MGRPRANPIFCTEPGCTNYTRARGLCSGHYEKLRRRQGPQTLCTVAGCPNVAGHGYRGRCTTHYRHDMREIGDAVRTPLRVVSATPWMAEAACRDVPTNTFFPAPPGTRGAPYIHRAYATAKAICARCPVIDQCLAYALDDDIPWGVFGGATPKERSFMKRSHA